MAEGNLLPGELISDSYVHKGSQRNWRVLEIVPKMFIIILMSCV